ncbi:WD40 repeat-like protein [Sparassis latifolia]|uniref:WD40 repeat-like protein n=1 Tax=Sparassis crispa TaxID=139825 RepID=A0A401GSS9_9APHY|nr:WD40 repeat-like protein [Sparassis crispa]GBE85301.1 WD40 repeat-like protein [Sparassis crispa]
MSLPCRSTSQLTDLGPLGFRSPIHSARSRKSALKHLLTEGFPYSKKLTGHTSCVNALAFSHGSGRWLASAGDDLHVLLWDFHQDDVNEASFSFTGPRANVFSLAFSATDQYLYSGDTDNKIYQYDLSYLSSAGTQHSRFSSAVFQQHDDSVRAISSHPVYDHIFMSAGEDGRIILHDTRTPTGRHSRAENVLQHDAEFTGVQYHPNMAHIFATSDNRGEVCLRDARMAFGPLSRRSQKGIVQTYVTTLLKHSHLSKPEVSSITFDYTGTRLAATMLYYYPVIYSVNDPYPLAICNGRNQPDGTPVPSGVRTYSNTCTIKHGSFGGPGLGDDCYYGAGSDDFCAYIWKIPDTPRLLDGRLEVDPEDWDEHSSTVGFANGLSQSRVVPMELPTPFCRLTGHQSIVNTTLMHPSNLHIATAGIERDILIHGPTPTSPCLDGTTLTPTAVRTLPDSDLDSNRLFRHAIGLGPAMDEPDDDTGAIALFDEIIRQEGDADVFVLRRWNPDVDRDIDLEEEGVVTDDHTEDT